MDKACVVGFGVVGQATASVFGVKKHFDVASERSNMTMEEVSKCRFVFICLPTPVDVEGKYTTTGEIMETIKQIKDYGGGCIYIIRSTVFPGFAKHVARTLGIDSIISNPEFLSEDTAEQDAKHPPFVLLGGSEGVFLREVKALYEGRLKGSSVILTDNTTAEISKLAMNAYFATKVIFANQLYDACDTLDANYETAKQVLESHPFGPKNHFKIWFKGKRGVNGRCLPKDAKAFAHYTNQELVHYVNLLNNDYTHLKES